MSEKILVIDDESDIRFLLKYNLEKEGFTVYEAPNGLEGIQTAKEVHPAVILLDVMMPEMDGIETCEQLRQDSNLNDTMICFLTARGEDYSQIAGLDAGADYYLTKPIKPKVLVSQISSMLRRRKSSRADIDFEETLNPKIVLNRERYRVMKEDEKINLPRKEFELLSLLMSKPGVVFERQEIMNTVWGGDVIVGDRTIDVHIRKLREKLGDEYIVTIKGVGYKFQQ
ncbi:MAG: response regulator transcription factor [Crocinitomicaceae bacterium]|nr:response regulator transcription factor [Crocinitomicaceae bacterium]